MSLSASMQLPNVASMSTDRPAEPSSASVRWLTAQIVRGNEEAFNRFYDEFSPRVFRFLIIVTAGDEDLSRELHQCVMITAARKLKTFENEEALWAWLAQVARNKWKDTCRKRKREARLLSSYSVDEPVAGTPRQERVKQALNRLTAPERDLIETFYFDDCPQKEIARDSGRTIKAIQCGLARVRQKLKSLLEDRQ
jgi:RNA polymerase sigma-70 factor (ECF subfamily)